MPPSSNPQPGRKGQPSSSTSAKQPAQPATVHARRTATKREREQRRQRILLTVVGSAVGLALLIVVSGLIYEQLWIPSRPVAEVNGTSLSRRDYWQERRHELSRQIVQTIQLLSLLGNNQSAQQFQGRVPALNQEAKTVRTNPVDDQTVTGWQDYQLTIQGAATITKPVQVSIDEINQQLVADLGRLFLPPPLITPTVGLPPPTATAVVTPTLAPTLAPGGPTATPAPTGTLAPTSTPAPTNTPAPTPGATLAGQQVQTILDDLFSRYRGEVTQAGQQVVLTREEFQAALEDQYRKQVFQRKIEEQLVSNELFTPKTEPNKVRVSQILLSTAVVSGTAAADRSAEAQALVTQLRAGADFAALAKEKSDDTGSKAEGGDLGYFGPDGKTDANVVYSPELVKAAFALPLDQISDPVKTEFGWVILKSTDRQLDSVEDQLRQARSAALDTWLKGLRAKLTLARYPEPTATVAAPTAAPLPTTVPTYAPGPPTPVPTTAPITTTDTLSNTGTLTNTK